MRYRGFSPDELEREYSPSAMVGGDISPYLQAYADMSAAVRQRYMVKGDLSYGAAAGQVLDVFPALPSATDAGSSSDARSAAGAPLHVFIHGGYWQALSQRDSAMMAPAILASGQAFATLNYTLAPSVTLGEMIAECRDALLFLGAQAKTLGIDPQRITLSGHSAGAHLAAMVLSLYGTDLTNAGLVITDAILISGVYDLTPIAEVSVNEPLQLSTDDIAALSPLRHIPEAVRHVRVIVAERDTGEFIRQSRDYAEHLRLAGLSVSFDLQPGRHHFDIILHAGSFVSPKA